MAMTNGIFKDRDICPIEHGAGRMYCDAVRRRACRTAFERAEQMTIDVLTDALGAGHGEVDDSDDLLPGGIGRYSLTRGPGRRRQVTCYGQRRLHFMHGCQVCVATNDVFWRAA